jgi:cation diffusion facilitator family transporter
MELHQHDLSRWRHSHRFAGARPQAERRTLYAVILTAVMMVVEIAAGWWFGSMALLADGWHMSSHVLALGLTLVAYVIARRLGDDPRFAMGTWKIEILATFASAMMLGGVALMMVSESLMRLWNPVVIHYNEALIVTVVGLVVNLICAFWLMGAHDHDHGHGHTHAHRHSHNDEHDHDHPHGSEHSAEHEHAKEDLGGYSHAAGLPSSHAGAGVDQASAATDGARSGARSHSDLNLRAAYLHVLADAATSIAAIIALLAGKLFGWQWMDPAVGVAGAILISKWAIGLLRESGVILLDRNMDQPVVTKVKAALESEPGVHVTDLHAWRVSGEQFACVVSLVAPVPQAPSYYKARLAHVDEVAHLTIEVNHCCAPPPGETV